MKLPLKFERLPEYEEAEKSGMRKLSEHKGYARENDGSWIIVDAEGIGVITPSDSKGKPSVVRRGMLPIQKA